MSRRERLRAQREGSIRTRPDVRLAGGNPAAKAGTQTTRIPRRSSTGLCSRCCRCASSSARRSCMPASTRSSIPLSSAPRARVDRLPARRVRQGLADRAPRPPVRTAVSGRDRTADRHRRDRDRPRRAERLALPHLSRRRIRLSILFWLTASWATKPYYYGPDLPYAFGWLTLALAGTGGRFTIETWLARVSTCGPGDEPVSRSGGSSSRPGSSASRPIAVAGLAGTVGAAVFGGAKADLGERHTDRRHRRQTASTPVERRRSDRLRAPEASAGGFHAAPDHTKRSARRPAQPARVGSRGRLQRPDTPAIPGVLLKLPDGTFVAFDAVCTHAGCTVEYDRGSGYLICPCHGATFDPAKQAQAHRGPDEPAACLDPDPRRHRERPDHADRLIADRRAIRHDLARFQPSTMSAGREAPRRFICGDARIVRAVAASDAVDHARRAER